MQNIKVRLLLVLVIAIIWGYFADLRYGENVWFIGRIIFMPLFYYFIFERLLNIGKDN